MKEDKKNEEKYSFFHVFLFGIFVCFCIFLILCFRFILGNARKYRERNKFYQNEEETIIVEGVTDITDEIEKVVEFDSSLEGDQPDIPEHKRFLCRKSVNPSKGEKACRDHLQKLFNSYFCTVRPDFLKNPDTGKRNFELDCYNPDLKVALEYQGEQHYRYVKKFDNGNFDLEKRKKYDMFKVTKCKEIGIILIVVPYHVKIKDIPSFINDELYKSALERKRRTKVKKIQ